MTDPPNSLPAALRSTRIFWATLLFAQFLYILAGSKILPSIPPTRSAPSFTIDIAIVAGLTLCLAILFHFRFVRRASESLQSNPTDAVAITRWRKAQIVTIVLVETLPLFGLALLTTGVPLDQVALFYVAGIAAMLFFFPKNPANQ